MEGGFWGSTTPLLYPILDPERHVIEDLTVAMGGDEVRVRMSGGAYDLVSPGTGDDPLFTDAVFTVEDGQLRAHTSGLHYVLPSKYLDDVRVVEVSDGRYGDFSWTTDIDRL